MRMFVATNHGYNFGPAHQQSFMQWEGVEGAARMTIGVNLDYPTGKPDTVEYATRTVQHDTWIPVPIGGNNFPAGFINSMSALQAYVDGTGPLPSSSLRTHIRQWNWSKRSTSRVGRGNSSFTQALAFNACWTRKSLYHCGKEDR